MEMRRVKSIKAITRIPILSFTSWVGLKVPITLYSMVLLVLENFKVPRSFVQPQPYLANHLCFSHHGHWFSQFLEMDPRITLTPEYYSLWRLIHYTDRSISNEKKKKYVFCIKWVLLNVKLTAGSSSVSGFNKIERKYSWWLSISFRFYDRIYKDYHYKMYFTTLD